MFKQVASKAVAAIALVGLCLGGPALAQENLTRIVVGFPAGGPQDFVARVVAAQLGSELHEKVIVENRPGANGTIAAAAVARSAPNGRTLWLSSVGAVAINPSLYGGLPYNVQRDFAPVSRLTDNAELLVVPGTYPVTTAAQFVEKGKADGGESIPMASTGIGSVPHLALEQFRIVTGIKILHVPYKGAAPAITDLLGSQVTAMFADTAAVISHVKSGRLKAIGIAAPQRTPALPDVPTLAEQGFPNVDGNNWFGLFVTAETPREDIDRLNGAIQRVLKDPQVREKLIAAGSEPSPSTPEELGAMVQADTAKWGKLVRDANIQAE